MIEPRNKVTPFLWFDTQAEDAARFYTSLIPGSSIVEVTKWGPGSPYPEGSTMSVTFELGGQQYIAFNGGKAMQLTDALSLFVSCDDQAEVDRYWDALTAGGTPIQCGWLRDRFGVAWQIAPKTLTRLISDPDPGVAGRAMQAMMGMVKIDIAAIERAAAGG